MRRSGRRWGRCMPSRVDAVLVVLLGVALCGNGRPVAKTIIVKPGGSIAAAIRAAHPGDHVVLSAGTYREPMIVIDRPLTLTGDPGAIIDGANATNILSVQADDVTV